jgi:hypothetical protein
MGEIKQFTTTKGAFAIVRVPDDAYNFITNNFPTNENNLWFYHNDGCNPLHNLAPIGLPEGDWQIIGLRDSLTEEQWKGIVEPVKFGMFMICFRDYEKEGYMFGLPSQSGHSLLKANGVYQSNPLGEKPRPFSYVKWGVQARAEQEWQEAQEKVYNPLILKKV